jgi:hypothetical protein
VNLVWHPGAVIGFPGVMEVPRMENVSLDDPHAENAIIPALDQGDYYALCSSMFSTRDLWGVLIPTETLIPLGTVLRLDPPPKASRITDPFGIDGANVDIHLDHNGEVLPSSWIRYFSLQTDFFLPLILFYFPGLIPTGHSILNLTYQHVLAWESITSSGWHKRITFLLSLRHPQTLRIMVRAYYIPYFNPNNYCNSCCE